MVMTGSTYSEEAVRLAVAQISQNIGWNGIGNQSLDILTQLTIKYIKELGKITSAYANHYNRCESNLDDLASAFSTLEISLSELEDYCNNVEPIPFVKGDLPPIPFPSRSVSRLTFPDENEAQTRGEQYNEWLPSLKTTESSEESQPAREQEDEEDDEVSGHLDGEEGETRTKDKISKSTSQYGKISGYSDLEPTQLTSVYITPDGEIVGINGREGKRPDPKLPPKTQEEEFMNERNISKSSLTDDQSSKKSSKEQQGTPTAPLKLKIKEGKKAKKINKDSSTGKVLLEPSSKVVKESSSGKKVKKEKEKKDKKEKSKEKEKEKGFKSLSIKVSGLTSGTPTATPSPSIARSPKSEHDLDLDSKHGGGSDLNESGGSQKQLDVSVDECISAVIARAAEEEEDGGSGQDVSRRSQSPSEDASGQQKKKKDKEKDKEKKKKERKMKKKKGQLMDETIDDVINAAMVKSDEIPQSKDVYSFNDDLRSSPVTTQAPPPPPSAVKSAPFPNPVHVDDDKEAAKILVSLAEEKKPKKSTPTKKSSNLPPASSTAPSSVGSAAPSHKAHSNATSPFQSSFSSSSFPKVSPGTTPLSPTSSLFSNPFHLNPSSAASGTASSVPTPPLFAAKGDSAFNKMPAASMNTFRSPFSPTHQFTGHPQAHRNEFGDGFSPQAAPPPVSKPPLKTLAEKKALPPEIGLPSPVVVSKEKKEKDKKEKKEKKKEKKEKHEGKESKKEKTKKSKKLIDPLDDLSSSDEKELTAASSAGASLVPKLMVKIGSSRSSATPSPSSTASSSAAATKLVIRATSSPAPSPELSSMAASTSHKETERRKDEKKEKGDKEKRKRKSGAAGGKSNTVSGVSGGHSGEKAKTVIKGGTDASCTVITETISTGENDEKVWICPACKKPDDGTPMIGCDGCDDWYHWICVGIKVPPKDEDSWFCNRCIARQQQIESKFKKKKHRYRDK